MWSEYAYFFYEPTHLSSEVAVPFCIPIFSPAFAGVSLLG